MIVQIFTSFALFLLVQPFAVWKNVDSKFRRTNDVTYFEGGPLPTSSNSKFSLLMQSSNSGPVNIALENVLNTRDIESACSNILPGKVFRAGCVSNASLSDVNFFHQLVGMKSWIDLRSAAEHEEDERLNSEVYEGYQRFHYNRKTNKFETTDKPEDKKRYFVSLMSESLIRKGIFYRLRKRNKFKVLAWFPLSVVSRRAYRRMKSVFIKEINDGGLSLLNQMVLEASGKAIIAVLKLIADENNLPTALFCTAGKDRTGLIAMLVLTILGASDEAIIRDYELSDSAYRDINNKRAMVASLSQSDLNPDIFLRARGQVMRDTMKYIRQKYGSINDFLDKYEFDENCRQKLRDALMVKYKE